MKFCCRGDIELNPRERKPNPCSKLYRFNLTLSGTFLISYTVSMLITSNALITVTISKGKPPPKPSKLRDYTASITKRILSMMTKKKQVSLKIRMYWAKKMTAPIFHSAVWKLSSFSYCSTKTFIAVVIDSRLSWLLAKLSCLRQFCLILQPSLHSG